MPRRRDDTVTVRDLPDDFLACRDLRHAWEPVAYFQERNGQTRTAPVIRLLRCLRCGTKRRDTLKNQFSEKTTHYYGHPEGYKLSGTGRTPSDVIRKEVVRRAEVLVVGHDELIQALRD